MFGTPFMSSSPGFLSIANIHNSLTESSANCSFPPPHLSADIYSEPTAVVKDDGYIALHLDHGMTVNISPDQAVLLHNPTYETKIAISDDGSHMTLAHPQGRVFQYNSRVEIQTQSKRTKSCGTRYWSFGKITISQTSDGLVTVERLHGRERLLLRSSPNNGKALMQNNFVYTTASNGAESHIFVKSNERRLHHNGELFVVRNGGHSAGFDASGQLRIF